MYKVHVIILFCTIGWICVMSDVPFKTCERTWRKVGCYRDLDKGRRALPEQMVNIRDPKSKVYAKPRMDWNQFSKSLHSLACLCAEKARAKGYEAFGLQFFGECWSGENAVDLYSDFGEADDKRCIMGGFVTCDDKAEQECVGAQATNYVYVLVEEPSSPGDGGWSEWGNWTQCDKTCGTGKQVRERTCTNPPPDVSGKDCEGPEEDVQNCKLTECPIDGGFTPWEPVPECTKTCGGGTQKFVRTCTNPPPQYGGNDCIGPKEKIGPCNEFTCPTPCTRSIDLGVILDATNSVGRIHFNIAKTFALALVNSMKIAPGGSHLGLMVYNIYPKILVRFNEKEKQHPAVVKSILHQETKLGGRTFTDRAIKAAATDLFTLKDGDRPDKQDVLVLVTDGRTNVASEPYEKVLQPLKDKGVKLIAVGVGENILNDELERIAMGKKENVIKVSDFDKLFYKLQEIIDSSCQSQ